MVNNNLVSKLTIEGQYLVFKMQQEMFGIPILQVREIIEYSKLIRVPMTTNCLRGIMNLRGQVIPVLDLAVFFGLGQLKIGPTTCIIVVEIIEGKETIILGILVEEVKEVCELEEAQIETAPSFGSRVDPKYLLGIGKLGEHFLLLLNLASSLNIEELSHLLVIK